MSVDLRHWQAFATAAETVHFGLAAEELNISQSALSQLIKTVEQQFGARLFDRSGRRVRLTEAGRLLLPEARAVLTQARRAEQIGRVMGRGAERRLAIGYVGSAVVHPRFARLVNALGALDPPISLRLDQTSVTDQAQLVLDRNIDIGMVRAPVPAVDPSIAFLRLGSDRMVVALGRSHGLACGEGALPLARLADEAFLEFRKQKSGGLNLLVRNACVAAGFEPRVVQTVPQIATMLCLVGAGQGIAVVPASAQRLGVPDVVYRELRDVIPVDLMLMYRRSDTAPVIRDLLKLVRSFDK